MRLHGCAQSNRVEFQFCWPISSFRNSPFLKKFLSLHTIIKYLPSEFVRFTMLSLRQYHADFVMANPAQMRKCEEELGKLPEKTTPTTRVRNPVWVFLKGIEGFDTERASECLVKLLDKHYDTVGVLKLATKQDLVEDAGVLPGDALRIVDAAREYVSPREPDHSSEPTPQHGVAGNKPGGLVAPSEAHPVLGVELLQHAYRPPALREKTVIFTPPVTSQASTHAYSPPVIQEKKGAASKQEAVKDTKVSAQTHPIPAGITYPHTCGICNVKCLSEINCRMHYNGRTHTAKFAEVLEAVKEAKQPAAAPKAVEETKQPTQSIPVVPSHACGVCNVKCTSEVDIRSHFNGRKHAQNMELTADSDDNRHTPFLYCSICNVNSACKRNLVMHLNGKKHAQNMKVDSDSGESSYYSDSESNY